MGKPDPALQAVQSKEKGYVGVVPLKEEDFENYTDPILEECYRMKEKFNAQFNSVEELSAHLRKVQEECRRKGMKIVSYYVPPEKRKSEKEINGDATLQKSSTENSSRANSQ